MKDILVNHSLTTLTILADKNSAAKEWGMSIITYFQKYAKKMSIQLDFIHDSKSAKHLSPGSLLIIFVDTSDRLNAYLEELAPLQLRILLLDVTSDDEHSNISHIQFDQIAFIQNSVELLKSKNRTKTAFFGVQKNDLTDIAKANAFAQHFSHNDVYHITDNVQSAFQTFKANIHRYDSVICANDFIAVYLLKQFRELGISVPNDLYVIGNGNTWIASHIEPGLTTTAESRKALVITALRLCNIICFSPDIKAMNVSLKFDLIERKSTASNHKDTPYNNSQSYPYTSRTLWEMPTSELCPDLLRINALNEALSSRTSVELQILDLLTKGNSYQEIAEEIFLSIDTVKYYVKKLYALLGINSRKELAAITEEYQLRYI